jgi:hypothetical protein
MIAAIYSPQAQRAPRTVLPDRKSIRFPASIPPAAKHHQPLGGAHSLERVPSRLVEYANTRVWDLAGLMVRQEHSGRPNRQRGRAVGT